MGLGVESSLAPILLYHLECLEEDDSIIVGLFENFNDPEMAMEYVFYLKEEGNSLFKKNDFSDALLNYQKAIKCFCVIICGVSEDFHLRGISIELKELIISLHLNVAACALKLNEFSLAIISCSLVLEIDGRNVKALFRRGLALATLGRHEEAYEDFRKAKEVEPNNKDIVREIGNLESPHSVRTEVKAVNAFKETKDQVFTLDVRGGIKRREDSEMVAPLKKSKHLQVVNTNMQDLDRSNDKEMMPSYIMEDKKGKKIMSSVDMASTSKNVMSEDNLSCMLEVEDENMTSEIASVCSNSKNDWGKDGFPVSEVEEHSGEASGIAKITPKNMSFETNFYVAEPKNRFQNRKRQGSIMMIPKKVYDQLVQGRSITYYNAKAGSILKVRVAGVQKSKQTEDKPELSPLFSPRNQENKDKKIEGTESTSSVEQKEELFPLESINESTTLKFEQALCEVVEDNFLKGDYTSCISGPTASYPENYYIKPDLKFRKANVKVEGRTQGRRDKTIRKKNFKCSNPSFGCRIHVGMKRKTPSTTSLDCHYRPWKKNMATPSYCYVNVESTSVNSIKDSKPQCKVPRCYCMYYSSKVEDSDRVSCISHESVIG
ncbi:hypothetical protein SOVF_126030 [Spinacia oleracea]|nr:hypothetical protein SOVF_126030 [Spinacia oleracea]